MRKIPKGGRKTAQIKEAELKILEEKFSVLKDRLDSLEYEAESIDEVWAFIRKNTKEIEDAEQQFGNYLLAIATTIFRQYENQKPLDLPLDSIPIVWEIYKKVSKVGYSIIDHCKVHKNEDAYFLISEPYNFSMEQMKELLNVCDLENIKFSINGYSHHYPGRCLRIYFFKEEN